jgi:hypothetical protein
MFVLCVKDKRQSHDNQNKGVQIKYREPNPSRPTVESTNPPVQWIPGCGFDHQSPSNAEVKERVEL